MKKLVITSIIAFLFGCWGTTWAQEFPEEYLGLPGDNLNLYAVMKLFQESETLEGFERDLNNENTKINNLDLNGDGYVDYIMVKDFPDGNVHNIVLRAAIGKNETQDVAVFIVQKYNDGTVQLQLVGDEALYGRNYIIEPYYTDSGETVNPAYVGNAVVRSNVKVVPTTTVHVASWPVISFIFHPRYVVWRSSWHWGYYPSYWNPWRPYYWHTYYGYHYHWNNYYYAHFRPWHHVRYPHYTTVYYTKVRQHSPTVIVNINRGAYKTTYSRPDLRVEGEKMYARDNQGRSSSNTAARVRTTGSTSVNKSAATSRTTSGRSDASVATRRTATQSATEVRSNASRSETNTGTTRTTTQSVNNRSTNVRESAATTNERSSGTVERKSATIREDAGSRTNQRSVTRSSTDRAPEVQTKSATPAPRSSAPSVNSGNSNRSSSAPATRSSSPEVRKSTPSSSSGNVSQRSTQRSQPAVKSAPSGSSSRQSGTSVGSSGSSGRSSAATGDSRSSSSRSSDRR